MTILPEGLSPLDAHRLLTSMFIPRPIALIGTVGKDGAFNLAPFSFASGVSSKPPVIVVSIADRKPGQIKDTLRNILDTGELTINIVTEAIMERMHASSAFFPPGVSEFDKVGLTPKTSDRIRAPGVAESPITMEVALRTTLRLEDAGTTLVLGDVLVYHVDDALMEGGAVVAERLRPVGRLGQDTYSVVRDTVKLPGVR